MQQGVVVFFQVKFGSIVLQNNGLPSKAQDKSLMSSFPLSVSLCLLFVSSNHSMTISLFVSLSLYLSFSLYPSVVSLCLLLYLYLSIILWQSFACIALYHSGSLCLNLYISPCHSLLFYLYLSFIPWQSLVCISLSLYVYLSSPFPP